MGHRILTHLSCPTAKAKNRKQTRSSNLSLGALIDAFRRESSPNNTAGLTESESLPVKNAGLVKHLV